MFGGSNPKNTLPDKELYDNSTPAEINQDTVNTITDYYHADNPEISKDYLKEKIIKEEIKDFHDKMFDYKNEYS